MEMEFDDWVEKKLSSGRPGSQDEGLDKSKRKYLRKREKRLYGSDSEDDRKDEGGFVELKPRVVEFDRLHEREEELYFYDAFAYPWDKDKHYKMVYKLEKKFFPEHCLDKAFVDEKEYKEAMKGTKNVTRRRKGINGGVDGGDRKFVFFDEDVAKEKGGKKSEGEEKGLVVEKVEEFFKLLKKVPRDGDEGGDGEPYLVTRSTELPPRWDGPNGTIVLINKPKGVFFSRPS